MNRRIAVVTGASSGLGRTYVQIIDHSRKIDEIWLIARREDRLRELADTLRHQSRILAYDLTAPDVSAAIAAELKKTCGSDSGTSVTLFVSCAGSGKIGNWQSISSADNDKMIDLNCRAAVDMTVAVLPFMKRGGRIIEICSTAAFQPLQQLAVYAATKAFLLSYSRALRWELFPRGIRVTAVCPYWMRQTEFIGVAKNNSGKESKAVRNYWFGDIPAVVVHLSLWGSAINLPVVTPGIVCTLHRIITKSIPREFLQLGWEGWRRI
jgi:uncharacterized protein